MTAALTLSQPYASLVALGVKQIETRSWSTRHRGRLLIHAGRAKVDRELERRMLDRELLPWRWTGPGTPLGVIVAVAQLVDVRPVTPELRDALTPLELELGDYAPGRYAWLLADVTPLPTPVPARGRLMLWDGPEL